MLVYIKNIGPWEHREDPLLGALIRIRNTLIIPGGNYYCYKLQIYKTTYIIQTTYILSLFPTTCFFLFMFCQNPLRSSAAHTLSVVLFPHYRDSK